MGSKGKSRSVTFKMSLYLSMLITFLMAAVGFGYYQNTRAALHKEALDKGWILVHYGTAVSAGYLYTDNLGPLSNHLYKMRANGDISYISVINAAGKIVAHTDQAQVGKTVSFSGGFPSGNTVTRYSADGGKTGGYDYLSPIAVTMGGSPIGYLRLGLDTSRYDALMADLVVNMLLVSLAAIMAGIMLAGVMARRILKQPIQDLKEATEHIAAGNFAHRVPVRQMDELGGLATAFNSMTGYLANLFMSVRTSSAELTRSSQVILSRSQEFRLAAENAGRDGDTGAGADFSDQRQLEALRDITISAKKMSRLVDRLNSLSLQFKL